MRTWLPLLIAAALPGCGATAPAAEEEARPPAKVTCAPAVAATVREVVVLRGTVVPPPGRDAIVSSVVAGRVIRVDVNEGDVVAAGAVLAVVDDAALVTAVDEADAAVATAAAEADNAHAAQARAERLVAAGVEAAKEAEDARARAASADAALAAAESRRNLAGRERARSRVTSPIAGTVLHVLRQPGELVDGTPATALLEVAEVTHLELRADVAAVDLVRLPASGALDVVLDARPGEVLPGRLVMVSPAVDPATGLGSARIAIDASTRLRVGLAGQATLVVGEHPGVLVPATALRRGSDGHDQVVRCTDKDGKQVATGTNVVVGERRGDQVEIRAGLAAGQAIVVDRVLGLDDDTDLIARDPGEATP